MVANIAICLIHQANYLPDRQIKRLEQEFLKDGGLRERMTRARLHVRDRQRNGRSLPGKEPESEYSAITSAPKSISVPVYHHRAIRAQLGKRYPDYATNTCPATLILYFKG